MKRDEQTGQPPRDLLEGHADTALFHDRAMRRPDFAKRCQVEHDRERHRENRNHNQRKRANENVWSVQRKDLETAGCTQESGRHCYHEITDTEPVPQADKSLIFAARSAAPTINAVKPTMTSPQPAGKAKIPGSCPAA